MEKETIGEINGAKIIPPIITGEESAYNPKAVIQSRKYHHHEKGIF
jgi:hypothetical protein